MECQLDGVKIHYEIHGVGKPIIMLHGRLLDHNVLEGCMEPVFLDRPGWKRIYLDLPGMGKTKKEDWIKSSDQILDIVLEFIDNIIPDQNFLIVGESYGGYLTRGVINKRYNLVDGMLLICPLIIPNSMNRDVPTHMVIEKESQLVNNLSGDDMIEFECSMVVQNINTLRRFQDEVLCGLKLSDHDFFDNIKKVGYEFSFNVDELPKTYQKPVLIFTGRQDKSVGYKDAWKIIENFPRGTFAVLDKAGHYMQIEQDKIFYLMVNEWLSRVEEYTD